MPARPAGAVALGLVTQASAAHLGQAAASTGASVFSGDTLRTDAQGVLGVRSGAARLLLAEQTTLTVDGQAGLTRAELASGTLLFSTAKAAALEIFASEATIRPASDAPTVAQITVVGPKELRVMARKGALRFTYDEETRMIPEGASYRVMLDTGQQAPAPATFPTQKEPRKSGRSRKGFIFLLGGAMALTAFVAVRSALLSPDRP